MNLEVILMLGTLTVLTGVVGRDKLDAFRLPSK